MVAAQVFTMVSLNLRTCRDCDRHRKRLAFSDGPGPNPRPFLSCEPWNLDMYRAAFQRGASLYNLVVNLGNGGHHAIFRH